MRDGLVLGLDITRNMTLPVLEGMSSYGLLQMQKERKLVSKYIDELKIKTPGAKQLAGKLSGGNQQKIVLAKCLAMQPKVIMLDRQGTRLYTWFWPGEGRDRFREMHTMAVDSDGNLYGSDNQIGRTQKLVPRKDADPQLLIRR